MKNRKRIIVAFMLIAVMLLGIGYAALTDVLDITGTAELTAGNAQQAFDADVYFKSAEALDYQNSAKPDTAEVSLSDNDVALFNAYNLAAQGDTASFKFVINNDSDLEVTITPSLTVVGDAAAVAVADEWFSVASDWAGQPKVIAANSSIEYTVTVTLKKTATLTPEDPMISSKFSITLTAESADTVA